ncbi:MAG: NADH-quinone oxidoreductase subunit J [Puia sp.]|nr:NADH-quinone oxidoreductase subunit J [Puia sp.]
MNILFYLAAGIAIITTLRMITGTNAVHSLLYLIVSLLSVSVIFFLSGAPFIAALEVIIYAGAIMVLFVFVIMMLNTGRDGVRKEHELLKASTWVGPGITSAILFGEMLYMLLTPSFHPMNRPGIPPAAVGALLFSRYILIVELAAFLLAAGIIGAYHLGRIEKRSHHRYLKKEEAAL